MNTGEVKALLGKIHSTGYWRINIRPTRFQPDRIPSLSQCRDIIKEVKVSLRGWDYPHIDQRELLSGQDWIESRTDWMSHIEYWRFYQSAQFIHHLSCREDADRPSRKVLSMLGTLYTTTEVLLFASRLASKNLLEPAAQISIKLLGMDGRLLDEPGRVLSREYIARVDEITFDKVIETELLIATSSEIALDATVSIFERFNWEYPSRQVLVEDQRKLLERRL